jgi:hypothetical protein
VETEVVVGPGDEQRPIGAAGGGVREREVALRLAGIAASVCVRPRGEIGHRERPIVTRPFGRGHGAFCKLGEWAWIPDRPDGVGPPTQEDRDVHR